jgi:SAM-dependent methyltransferase
VLNLAYRDVDFERVTAIQARNFLPLLQNLLDGSERTILDLGCGPGRFTGRLAELSTARVVGLDPVQSLVALAPRHDRVDYAVMETDRIPLADQSADVIWICLVLGGIPSPGVERTIREIWRVLKPSGLLFLVENTSSKRNGAHWIFRSFPNYKELFPFVDLAFLGEFDDLSEQLSIMAGRKLAVENNLRDLV